MLIILLCCRVCFCSGGVERGFKPYPRLAKMVLSATLTQDPGKLVQLNLHHPLFLSAGKMRYQLPENLESYKLVGHCISFSSFILSLFHHKFGMLLYCWVVLFIFH